MLAVPASFRAETLRLELAARERKIMARKTEIYTERCPRRVPPAP